MKKVLMKKTIPIIPGDPGNPCETRKRPGLMDQARFDQKSK